MFYWQRRHGDFELARLLHADLTSGEVAKALDLLGTLLHSPNSIRDDDLPTSGPHTSRCCGASSCSTPAAAPSRTAARQAAVRCGYSTG